MKFNVGDKVRIKSIDWYYDNRDRIDEVACGNINFIPDMTKYCKEIVTISAMLPTLKVYHIKEDGGMFNWSDDMIEGLVEDEALKQYEVPTGSIKMWDLPNGYIFKDENGNVINATKIVLEKKKKDVSLTQEQINTMVHDSCVLFCKHCGCGIPRDTCTSLGTCKEHDEYRATMRAHLMEKKKKEYPKTYGECCKVLDIDAYDLVLSIDYRSNKMKHNDWKRLGKLNALNQILICRDVYWKIAGEEMGLGKPWEPDWLDDDVKKYVITSTKVFETFGGLGYINYILTFPTEEMRDAFYENFKELIEICKELL